MLAGSCAGLDRKSSEVFQYKQIEKTLAAAIAVGTMATSMLGMSASAYAPTITQTFTVYSDATATATLYEDGTYAYAKLTLSNGGTKAAVKVTLTYAGTTKTGSGSTTADAKIYGSGSSATAKYEATAGSSSGYGTKSITLIS